MMRDYRAPPKRNKPPMEFSKLILLMVMLTYFVGVVIGALVVLDHAPEELTAYLTFIGAPTATAIGFYAWKAKAENVHKIDKEDTQHEDYME